MLPHELQNVVSITINDDEFEVTEAATVTIKRLGRVHSPTLHELLPHSERA